MRSRSAPDRFLPWICAAACGVWYAAVAVRFPAADGDLLWQRWLGERILRDGAIPRALGDETFAAAGAPWTPHEWLFSLAYAASGDHGAGWLVPVSCALAATAALWTVAARCARRGVAPTLATAAIVLCTLATMQSFGARAQVFGWAGLALLLLVLESDGPWMWAAIPLTVVWANLHASVMLAPALATLFAVAALVRERAWTPAVTRAATIAASCAAAVFATPLGADLPRYALALVTSPIRQSISEWGATSAASPAFVLGALPLVFVLAAFGVRAAPRDRILACAFLALLFAAVRNVPVFALAVAPIAVAALPRRRAALAVRPAARLAAWGTLAVLPLAIVTVAAATWRQAPPAADALPYATAGALLARATAPPRVFCEDFAWCSVFLADPRPARFFMDGRCDPYPPALWRAYREVLDGNAHWAAILDAQRVDAVLVRRDGALDSLLAERAGWRRIAADGLSRLYVRPRLLARQRTDAAPQRLLYAMKEREAEEERRAERER